MHEIKEELCIMVDNLIERGKEGNYWDFKREWPKKMSELLKDIICFTNTVHDSDCYLIYGIDDNLNITGIEKTNNRYKQADIIDAISVLHFAGDVLPIIEAEEIIYKGHSLDILIIKNISKTPIYLKKSYGEMLQGCIYSREGDKNTPNKGNSDIQTIEYLWRKRLGLTKSKTDYFYDILAKREDWNEEYSYFYNIYNPEFTIEFGKSNYNSDEFYFYVMMNENGYFQNLNLKYHDTVLDTYETAILDSGRLQVPTPKWGKIENSNNRDGFSYKFYVRGSTTFKIHSYLYNWKNHEERLAFNRLKEVIIIYESLEEKERFETFIHKNFEKVLGEIKDCNEFNHVNTGNENTTNLYKERLNTGYILVKLLEEWKRYNKYKSIN